MRRFFLMLIALCASALAFAQNPSVPFTFDQVWARSGPSSQVSAAYLAINNKGGADRLIAARCECAKATELHTMQMHGDVMTMQQVTALDIPANGAAVLQPGGNHVMLIGLKRSLVDGQTIALRLRFEKAGEIVLPVTVKNPNDAAAHGSH